MVIFNPPHPGETLLEDVLPEPGIGIAEHQKPRIFQRFAQTGKGKVRKYIHDAAEGSEFHQEPGTFTPWNDMRADADLLFFVPVALFQYLFQPLPQWSRCLAFLWWQ